MTASPGALILGIPYILRRRRGVTLAARQSRRGLAQHLVSAGGDLGQRHRRLCHRPADRRPKKETRASDLPRQTWSGAAGWTLCRRIWRSLACSDFVFRRVFRHHMSSCSWRPWPSSLWPRRAKPVGERSEAAFGVEIRAALFPVMVACWIDSTPYFDEVAPAARGAGLLSRTRSSPVAMTPTLDRPPARTISVLGCTGN